MREKKERKKKRWTSGDHTQIREEMRIKEGERKNLFFSLCQCSSSAHEFHEEDIWNDGLTFCLLLISKSKGIKKETNKE